MNLTDEGFEELVGALKSIAFWLKYLGNGDAATPMGAIEAFGKVVEDSSQQLYDGLKAIAEAIESRAE